MLDRLIDIINHNKSVFVAIFIILLFVTVSLYKKCSMEYMTDVAQQQDPIAALIEKNYVGINKKILLATTLNNVNYNLVALPKSICTNIDGKTADCTNNVLALMDVEDVKSRTADYEHKLDEESKRCNFDQKLKCEDMHKDNKDEIAKCDKKYDICNKQKYFINMFSLDKAKTQDQFILIANPNSLTSLTPEERLANSLIGTHGYKYICVDGSLSITDAFNGVSFIPTTVKQEGGIIGGTTNDSKYKIRMGRQAYDGNKLLFDKNGDPVISYMYLGTCSDAQTCKIGDKDIRRICLYEDIMDKNVLEFSINVVN
jgi:hypothetical protein